MELNLDAIQEESEFDEVLEALHNLQSYTKTKRDAVRYRLAGYVDKALMAENHCDKIYHRLPKWARW